jgi:hypothetical protein
LTSAVILVEGESDRAALLALAALRGRDLDADDVAVQAMGGATNIVHYLDRYGSSAVRVAGLCDLREERGFRRGLERAGLGDASTRAGLERLGFFVCEADLEDELIRALGVRAVLEVVEAAGESGLFRTLQNQPAQRDRPVDAQLRRFLGSRSGRKIRYGRLLVEALAPDQVPRPLDAVLAAV